MKRMMLCECGEFVGESTFKDYIPTSANPSTPTIGHSSCGLIFNFIDGKLPKRFSSRAELKGIAVKFAELNKMDEAVVCGFLLEVDRLKSKGKLCDMEILREAYQVIVKK